MNITVYLGANEGNNPSLKRAVKELGTWIGKSGNALIYGGSKSGLMGALADSVLNAGGNVTGVEPQFFIENEFQHEGITKLIVTKDMSERKNKMIELGNAFIAFPGGTGTLEEIMKGYADTYGCTLIATTRREAVSPTHHNFNSKIYMNGNFYEEEPYNNIEVIDRIGSGDAYLAGVLYGLIKFGTPERAIEIGNALSAVKNTVAGDMSASSIEEIESVIKSHKATGHQDEMVR